MKMVTELICQWFTGWQWFLAVGPKRLTARNYNRNLSCVSSFLIADILLKKLAVVYHAGCQHVPNIDSCRRFTSAVFKAHLVAVCWLVDRGALIVPNTLAGKAARNLQTTEGLNIADLTLIASRLLRRFQKSPGCHACWTHGISQRACLQRGGEDKGDTGPVIDTCKNWNWYTCWSCFQVHAFYVQNGDRKKISCRIRAGQTDSGCCSCSLSMRKPTYYVFTNSMKTRCQWARICSKLNACRRDPTCHNHHSAGA